jgi:hypothetical protein
VRTTPARQGRGGFWDREARPQPVVFWRDELVTTRSLGSGTVAAAALSCTGIEAGERWCQAAAHPPGRPAAPR